MHKRFTVDGADSHGILMLRSPFGEPSEKPLPRPFMGSSTTGVHTTPPAGAQVLALYEDGLLPYPSATYTATDSLGALPALAASETAIYGARGEVLSYATATGPSVLYRNAGNTLSITADTATGRINIVCSDGLYINGVKVTAP